MHVEKVVGGKALTNERNRWCQLKKIVSEADFDKRLRRQTCFSSEIACMICLPKECLIRECQFYFYVHLFYVVFNPKYSLMSVYKQHCIFIFRIGRFSL